jgi:CRP/FNR family transcriptional regulator
MIEHHSISESEIKDLKSLFPDLYEPTLIDAIKEKGLFFQIHSGEHLIDIGQYIKFMPLLLSGGLKIMREDNDGRELLLYHIQPGETCAMSLTCCMGDAKSTVRAEAEEDTTLIAIPIQLLDQWSTQYISWKHFIMSTYQKRFEDLLRTIDGIAFQKLDDRLIHLLKEKVNKHGQRIITTTHQEIANELHSSREVISRLLKRMENDGWLQLGRNKIEWLKG